MERLTWDLALWIDGWIRRGGGGEDGGNDNNNPAERDGHHAASQPWRRLRPPAAATSSSSSYQVEASSSQRCRPGASYEPGRDREVCRSEGCRYCRAMEKTLLWEDSSFLVNVYLIVLLNATIWVNDMLGLLTPRGPFSVLVVYFMIQITVVLNFMDTLAPAVECRTACSRLHRTWKSLRQLRSEQPGLYCTLLCVVAFGLYLLGHINLPTPRSLCWGIMLGPLVLRLPQKLFAYYKSRKEWQCDSEIDEFLPLVTEANLQVLSRVGETGDHSPTPTSVLSDAQNDSFNDEEYIEGLYDIALSMPSHEEGSTDGVELSELELSVGENEAEEDDIKFQAGHFEKSSSSSSSEEEAFDRRVIAVSSDESNDSDYEIIDKAEIENVEM